MNLVIDDAVEVKQITKTNSEEKRRQLGTRPATPSPTRQPARPSLTQLFRANPVEGRQRLAYPGGYLNYDAARRGQGLKRVIGLMRQAKVTAVIRYTIMKKLDNAGWGG